MKKAFKTSLISLFVVPNLIFISACNNIQTPYEYKEAEGKVSYLVSFNTFGGTPIESQYDSVIEEMPTSSKEGHVLKGWYIETETDLVCFPYTLTKDVTLNASWAIATYSCTFETNGGTPVDPITDVNVIDVSPTTAREGYDFAGWHLESDLSDDFVSFPLTLKANTVLYAAWSKREGDPSGTLLAIAKVNAMESKSYWSFEYDEEALHIHAEVSDPFLYSYYTNPGYNDNVEVVLCPQNRTLSAGYAVGNTHHLLCDLNGNGYYNSANTVYSLTGSSPLPETCQVAGRKTSLEADGFTGYVVDFYVEYSLFGLIRETALNNISMAVGMRNTNSYTATIWGAPLYSDYLSCWSYLLLKEDGTFEKPDLDGSSIIVGGSNFAISNHHSINTSLENKNTFVYAKEDQLENWENEAKSVSLFNADKLILNIGRYDYYKGVLTNDELINATIDFAKYYIPSFGASNIYVTSIEPLSDLPKDLATLQTINTNINNKCLESGMNYIDTYSLFVTGSTLNTSYYKNNFVFSDEGLTAYYDLIKTYL